MHTCYVPVVLLCVPRYAFEVLSNPTCDMLSAEGFLHALMLIRRLKPSSLVHLAPVCSSWVWVNRGTSKRSREHPLGDTSLAYICQANQMVSRVIMICLVATARGHTFVIEQPSSSVMDSHPKFAFMMKLAEHGLLQVHSVRTWFGMFGGESPKPTTLWGNPSWLDQLRRKYDKRAQRQGVPVTERYTDKRGALRVKGLGENLKNTQSAPKTH